MIIKSHTTYALRVLQYVYGQLPKVKFIIDISENNINILCAINLLISIFLADRGFCKFELFKPL